MKKAAICLFVGLLTVSAFGQTTIDLFDPVRITASPGGASDDNPFTFLTSTVYLTCPADATATVSGNDGGLLIADNFLRLNGTNICPAGGSCFATTLNDPMQHLGEPAEVSYVGIGPIDISSMLTQGNARYTFTLIDAGYTYASNSIDLNTTCTRTFPVCHRNNGRGKPGQTKTLYVGSQEAVEAHMRHGDTPGPCPASPPVG